MVASAKDRYYYTAKKVDGDTFEFHKWDTYNDDMPTTTYKTHPYGATAASCSCPAFRPCKHMKAVDYICDNGLADELPFLKWTEKHGWVRVNI
jgi:hypothetical protein